MVNNISSEQMKELSQQLMHEIKEHGNNILKQSGIEGVTQAYSDIEEGLKVAAHIPKEEESLSAVSNVLSSLPSAGSILKGLGLGALVYVTAQATSNLVSESKDINIASGNVPQFPDITDATSMLKTDKVMTDSQLKAWSDSITHTKDEFKEWTNSVIGGDLFKTDNVPTYSQGNSEAQNVFSSSNSYIENLDDKNLVADYDNSAPDYMQYAKEDHRNLGSPYTKRPTGQPTGQPSFLPTSPSSEPSQMPTAWPSPDYYNPQYKIPTAEPTHIPSSEPSGIPSVQPTSIPSSEPTHIPTSQPTTPTSMPTYAPGNSTNTSDKEELSDGGIAGIVIAAATLLGLGAYCGIEKCRASMIQPKENKQYSSAATSVNQL